MVQIQIVMTVLCPESSENTIKGHHGAPYFEIPLTASKTRLQIRYLWQQTTFITLFMEKIVWRAAGMSEVIPKWSKLVRSSLLHLFYKMVIFGRLVSWFLGFSYQGDYFYQLVYTFLMLMQLSDAQNSCFKLKFGPFEANMRKGAPRGATICVYQG